MGVSKLALLLPFGLLAAGAVADPNVLPDDPREILFRAMDKSRWLNLESIVVRRMSSADRTTKQIRIAQRGGMSKSTVLSPLPEQGVTTVDDGKTWTTYFPDDNLMVIQDSPKRSSWNWRRQAVADDNYRFTFEKVESIAGRKANTILATPKFPEMPIRRYSLDLDYPLLLKMEVAKDGRFVTMMDTKAIAFTSVDEDAIQINPPAEVRKAFHEAPQRFRSAAEALEIVGFKPSMPGPLPFGFVISEPQVIGDRGRKFIAIRVSDGLASATVYQWNGSERDPIPCRDPRYLREANGLKMSLTGDLPEVVLTRLLETFVREALKGLQPLLGTDFDLSALLSLHGEEGEAGGSTILIIQVAP